MVFNEDEFMSELKAALKYKGEITLESRFREDLDADSIDLMELLLELEIKLGIEIDEAEAMSFNTVGDIIHYLKEI